MGGLLKDQAELIQRCEALSKGYKELLQRNKALEKQLQKGHGRGESLKGGA